MAVTVIHGKPRSGKTCYCVLLLATMLADWARYELKHEKPYPRILYTNVPLDVEALNAHISAEIGTDVDISGNIELLDDVFFRDENGGFREWWLDFETGAYIVIDEVHHYLPASVKRQKGGQAHADKWMNYVSMHGHAQQDIVLLTQHMGNVSTEVRKQVEIVFEVLNIKNQIWGIWPFTIPLSDIDVVREAWGMPAQFAHIKRGTCTATKIEYDKTCEVFLLLPSIFALYRSHTKSDEAFDRPSLRMGKAGSLLWIFRRHFVRLGVWAVVLAVGASVAWNVFWSLPGMLTKSLSPKKAGLPAAASSPDTVTTPDGETRHAEPAKEGDDEIIGFVRGGVITPKGVKRINDHIIYEGEKDYVQSVDVLRGVLYLGSGKKVQK